MQWKRDNSIKDTWGPNDEHDTISTLARDNKGNLSGACTTSGLAYKLHGRVGDSPIIGAGMFVDNEIGAVVLRIIEVIGEDKLESLDEDTLYFIISALNQLNIDYMRNKILLKVLPLKV